MFLHYLLPDDVNLQSIQTSPAMYLLTASPNNNASDNFAKLPTVLSTFTASSSTVLISQCPFEQSKQPIVEVQRQSPWSANSVHSKYVLLHFVDQSFNNFMPDIDSCIDLEADLDSKSIVLFTKFLFVDHFRLG